MPMSRFYQKKQSCEIVFLSFYGRMYSFESFITFSVYLLFLLVVGIFFYRKTKNLEDYLLGGRKMGAWVTALSAQASDMSGWLLMGLPGAIYLNGTSEAWIALGLFIGTVANWFLVAGRLRLYTAQVKALTLASFFANRFADPSGLLRNFSALITLFFFTIYAASGLVAAGKLFHTMFGIDYVVAVTVGGFVIVFYTFMGGFLAVAWTDLLQGSLMFFTILIAPIIAMFQENLLVSSALTSDIFSSWFENRSGTSIGWIAILSSAAWGLGYFGQPHILARFMSIKSLKELKKSISIAIVWVAISLAGAVFIGLVGKSMFPQVALIGNDAEKVFIYMLQKVFSPWVAGVLLAAILSAIMSTIDSQLLVSSSTLTEDFYKKAIKRDASEKELIWVGRVSVILISIIAFVIALGENKSVLSLVSYAWGGFGAAFGPLIIMALYSRKTTWKAALGGMVMGTLTMILWKFSFLGSWMYEIVPGIIMNFAAIFIINIFFKEDNPQVLQSFDEIEKELNQ